MSILLPCKHAVLPVQSKPLIVWCCCLSMDTFSVDLQMRKAKNLKGGNQNFFTQRILEKPERDSKDWTRSWRKLHSLYTHSAKVTLSMARFLFELDLRTSHSKGYHEWHGCEDVWLLILSPEAFRALPRPTIKRESMRSLRLQLKELRYQKSRNKSCNIVSDGLDVRNINY